MEGRELMHDAEGAARPCTYRDRGVSGHNSSASLAARMWSYGVIS
jgi:hypothetical protein